MSGRRWRSMSTTPPACRQVRLVPPVQIHDTFVGLPGDDPIAFLLGVTGEQAVYGILDGSPARVCYWSHQLRVCN